MAQFYVVDYATKNLYDKMQVDNIGISFARHPDDSTFNFESGQFNVSNETARWVLNVGCGEENFPEVPWNEFPLEEI